MKCCKRAFSVLTNSEITEIPIADCTSVTILSSVWLPLRGNTTVVGQPAGRRGHSDYNWYHWVDCSRFVGMLLLHPTRLPPSTTQIFASAECTSSELEDELAKISI